MKTLIVIMLLALAAPAFAADPAPPTTLIELLKCEWVINGHCVEVLIPGEAWLVDGEHVWVRVRRAK